MHSGRLNFFHRSWGPLEPFDHSFPVLLRKSGVYTHLISDHYHYFEDGGWSYHDRYSSWEYLRGQEGDKWKAMVKPPLERLRDTYHPIQFDQNRDSFRHQAMLNREHIVEDHDFPSVRCIDLALSPEEFVGATLVDPFDFTRGMPLLRLPALPTAKRPPIQGGGSTMNAPKPCRRFRPPPKPASPTSWSRAGRVSLRRPAFPSRCSTARPRG